MKLTTLSLLSAAVMSITACNDSNSTQDALSLNKITDLSAVGVYECSNMHEYSTIYDDPNNYPDTDHTTVEYGKFTVSPSLNKRIEFQYKYRNSSSTLHNFEFYNSEIIGDHLTAKIVKNTDNWSIVHVFTINTKTGSFVDTEEGNRRKNGKIVPNTTVVIELTGDCT